MDKLKTSTIFLISAILFGFTSIAFAVGAFPVATGGTGWTNFTANTILLGNGTSPLATTTAGSNGQYLVLLNGLPQWATATTSGAVTSVTGTYPIISSGGATPAISTAFGTTTANVFNKLNTFTNSTSTLLTCTTCWIGTLGQALNAGNFLINNVLAPVSGGDATNKTYVDNAVAGVNPAVAVQAATTQASDTSGLTYFNGVSGVGATFTGSLNTAITIDGYTFTAINQRLLVKNDTQSPSGAFNGVYYVTTIQSVGVAPVFTRALDYDMPSDINNTGAIPVINGTVNGSTSWVINSSVTTVGTDPLTYTKFSLNPSTIFTTAGTGLTGSGNTVAMKSYFGTTTADTSGQVLFWGSTNATPALFNSSSNFTFVTNLLTVTNASTTNATASQSLFVSSKQVNPYQNATFAYGATSTAWAGTTTETTLVAPFAGTLQDVQCVTSAGTLNVQAKVNSSNVAPMFNASTTKGTVTFTANNTFVRGDTLEFDFGTPASSPTNISCTPRTTVTSF